MGAPRIDMVVSVPLMPDPKSLDREQALYMAKLAEQAERYEDMVKYMKQIVDLGFKANELSVEERNLLSVGYKNMMSVRRTSWRTVQQLCDGGDADESNPVYRDTIAKEVFELITEVCDDVVKRYVEGENKAEEKDVEVHVFFKKMEGDYNRYGAEITEGDVKEKYKEAAKKAYKEASEEAKELAKNAFDTAIDHLDALEDDEYKDSTLIMQLLKDNLTLWSTDQGDQDDIEVVDVDEN